MVINHDITIVSMLIGLLWYLSFFVRNVAYVVMVLKLLQLY